MSKPVRLVNDVTYDQMYRLEWEDGVKSQDMYNLTRAKDILKNYSSYRKYMKQSYTID